MLVCLLLSAWCCLTMDWHQCTVFLHETVFVITLLSECWNSQTFQIPAVCQETAVSMARAVTAWRRAGGPFSLEGLPGEGRAVKKTFLLPTCRQGTTIGTAVSGVLSTDVAQTVTARNWTPGDKHKTLVQLIDREQRWKCRAVSQR